MIRFLPILLTALLLAATSPAQLVYQSPSPGSPTTSHVFALSTTVGDLRITGLELYLAAGNQTVTIECSRSQINPNAVAWAKLGTATVYSQGIGTPTNIPIGFDVYMSTPEGLFFRATTTSNVYVNQTGFNGSTDYGPAGLEIRSGPMSNGSEASFCGRIHYSSQAGGPRAVINGTVAPTFTGFQSAGATFDIEAREHDLVIDGLQMYPNLSTGRYRLYTTVTAAPAAAVPFDASSWRLIGDTNVYQTGVTSTMPLEFQVIVPKGTRRGFYLVDPLHGALDTGFLTVGIPASVSNANAIIHSGELHGTSTGNDFGASSGAGYLNVLVLYRAPTSPSATVPGATGALNGPQATTNVGQGMAFDLTATNATSLNSMLFSVVSTAPLFNSISTVVDLYTTVDGKSYAGQLNNPAAWTKIGSASIGLPFAGLTVPAIISGFQNVIAPNEPRGFYITTSHPQSQLRSGAAAATPGVVASDGHLSISTGTTTSSNFVPTTSLFQASPTVGYRLAARSDLGFSQDFSSGSAQFAPTHWLVSTDDANAVHQGWRFDNPGGRAVPTPLSSAVACIDAGPWSPGNPIAASLYSPLFDASKDVGYTLSYDSSFLGGGTSQAWVEVWDGTTWNIVKTYPTTQLAGTHESFDVKAAAGGSTNAMVRFRFQGDGNHYWMIDNVSLRVQQLGQRPQFGRGEFDINNATDGLHGLPVACGLPGPYHATTSVFGQTVFHWEGEPNQPIQLFAGILNLGNVVLNPQGQLDVGSYDPITMTFPGLFLLADGTSSDLFNSSFRTTSGGELDMAIYLPPYLQGYFINLQSLIFSSTQNIALTNVVILDIL